MYEKCTKCPRLGKDCFPNLYSMSFYEIKELAKNRMKYLGVTYEDIYNATGIPESTVKDNFNLNKNTNPRYSTFAPILLFLFQGNLEDSQQETPCRDNDAELLKQISELTQINSSQAETLSYKDENIQNQQNIISYLKQEKNSSDDFLKKKLSEATKRSDRWRTAFLVSAIVTAVLTIGFLLFDLSHPGIGYFRAEPSIIDYFTQEESADHAAAYPYYTNYPLYGNREYHYLIIKPIES